MDKVVKECATESDDQNSKLRAYMWEEKTDSFLLFS